MVVRDQGKGYNHQRKVRYCQALEGKDNGRDHSRQSSEKSFLIVKL